MRTNMKSVLLIFCLGFISLCAYSQNKLINGNNAAKVVGTVSNKPSTTTRKPAKISKDIDAKYSVLGYMDISGIVFANEDKDDNIINDYGSDTYASEIKYLQLKLFAEVMNYFNKYGANENGFRSEALYLMGKMYENGEGIVENLPDRDKAIEWYKQCSSSGASIDAKAELK